MRTYEIADRYRMLDRSEVDLLQDVARMLPREPICINIGAGTGTSGCAILEVRPDAFVFSIDKKPEPRERESLQELGFETSRCLRILSDSARAGEFWPIPVDLVFVDGGHTVAQATADTLSWRPRIKKGGYMLFHDYKHRNLPNLTPAIDALMEGYERVGEARYLVAFRIL